MSVIELYPLLTQARYVEPIWGGPQLARWLHLPNPEQSKLGEVWQVYDQNLIVNGSLAGQTLAEVTSQFGPALVGTTSNQRYGHDFPLLLKFIAAAQPLSVQVHPDDAYAHTHEAATGFHGKTEAWYILEAENGAEVIHGFREATTRQACEAALAAGTLTELLRQVPVNAGDLVFVPAKTIHAINPGVVLFEIQQKSDLTYRVYDYDRRDASTGLPRQLHLEQAFAVLDFAATEPALVESVAINPNTRLLVRCPFFSLEHWQLNSIQSLSTSVTSFDCWTVINGSCSLGWSAGSLELSHGMSVIVPAQLGQYQLYPEPSAELLRAYV
ncbi:type I phosphomannose isomerase catalytic subunit [Herpetosiphon geysericola]|uniref:Phosphohexomutase n=1 Tax=Herpetosiphon geysericola TaxID=70996 RepID=A0A0P6YUU1_9CHLR|nr:type I phosphomannose isomerase catalytic subunit [Herpetosiphon geysericola]KPL88861.1 mannose-6-phosphate isomerase [Herpetosiphon geysericola]